MGAKKAKKKAGPKLPEELTGLGAEVAGIDTDNKESIIRIGTRLEQAWTALRVGGAKPPVLDALKGSLTALQKLYQDELSDGAEVWELVGEAVQAVEEKLTGGRGDKRLATVNEGLRAILSADRAGPKTKTPQPAASQPQVDTGVLTAIEVIAARLMGADPTDADQLKDIHANLLKVLALPSLAGGAMGHLTVAAQLLEMAAAGQAGNPEEVVSQSAKALGQAADVQEAHQNGENVAAPPPAEQPAPETNIAAGATPSATEKIEFPGPAVMADDVEADLLNEYIIESLDHITNAEGSLLELESNPSDRGQIDVVFRAFHTIKGTSGFLGFDRIQKCAHLAENLLDRAREGEIAIRGGYADLCLRSCDCLRTMLEGLHGIGAGEELPLPDDLAELLEILSDPEAAGFGEQEGEKIDMRVGDILVAKGQATRRDVENAEKTKGDKKIGEALMETGTASPVVIAEAIRTQKQIKQAQTAPPEGSIRVGTGRLDNLINMAGELVIAQSMVTQDTAVTDGTNPRLRRNVAHAGKIIRELQDLTMSLRMVPLKGVFQKMNRLVRDLSRKSGKEVRFITDGEETEIDRNMVESLNDPLVHMIRNSVDHGVEKAKDRLASGKAPAGTVCLRAFHSAGNVVIELQDDGKGLDREKIIAKAVERGIIEKGKEISDTDVFNLVFAAGFSTAEKVTDVSGRGVGMDVVKRNIEKLRGRVEVASKAAVGSTFTVRLPLTLAIADAMIVSVGQNRYLLPTISIERSIRPADNSISTVTASGEMVMLRGELLPIFRLYELFGITDAQTDPYKALLVVIEGDGRKCALMVDELLGQQQVVIKSLGKAMTKVPGISGGAILGNGEVGLILDAAGLLQLAEGRAEPAEQGAVLV